MPRDRPLPGGKLEYAVFVAVWEGGTLTVRELHERVGVPPRYWIPTIDG